MRRYTVLLYPELEDGGYSVLVPALGIATVGVTVEDGLSNAREMIGGYLVAETDRGEDVPEEAGPPVVASVEVEELAPVAGRAQ